MERRGSRGRGQLLRRQPPSLWGPGIDSGMDRAEHGPKASRSEGQVSVCPKILFYTAVPWLPPSGPGNDFPSWLLVSRPGLCPPALRGGTDLTSQKCGCGDPS